MVTLHDGTQATVDDLILTHRNDRRTTVRGGRDRVKNGHVRPVVGIGADDALEVQ